MCTAYTQHKYINTIHNSIGGDLWPKRFEVFISRLLDLFFLPTNRESISCCARLYGMICNILIFSDDHHHHQHCPNDHRQSDDDIHVLTGKTIKKILSDWFLALASFCLLNKLAFHIFQVFLWSFLSKNTRKNYKCCFFYMENISQILQPIRSFDIEEVNVSL